MSERGGYLVVETRADRVGLVRVYGTPYQPASPGIQTADPGISCVRYAAFFSALHVARMHAQTALRHAMADAESGLYRTDPITASAAVDAIDLQHRRVYLDPEIEADPRFAVQVERRRRGHRRADRIWTAVGILGIILLILLSRIPVF